jgi:hypothetical protein
MDYKHIFYRDDGGGTFFFFETLVDFYQTMYVVSLPTAVGTSGPTSCDLFPLRDSVMEHAGHGQDAKGQGTARRTFLLLLL